MTLDISSRLTKKVFFCFSIAFAAKTRTKDKYRVVYSDHQRLELEKEFHYSRYITIRRKSELASLLALSERQVNTTCSTYSRVVCSLRLCCHSVTLSPYSHSSPIYETLIKNKQNISMQLNKTFCFSFRLFWSRF